MPTLSKIRDIFSWFWFGLIILYSLYSGPITGNWIYSISMCENWRAFLKFKIRDSNLGPLIPKWILPTQKGLIQKCGRITSSTAFLPLLSRGDLYGVIPSTTVLWPVHNPAFYSGLRLCQRRHHSLWWNMYPGNCSMDSLSRSLSLIEVLSVKLVPALRFKMGTSDSEAKMILLHKRV